MLNIGTPIKHVKDVDVMLDSQNGKEMLFPKMSYNRGFKFTHWNMKKQMNYKRFTQIKIMAVKETIKQ